MADSRLLVVGTYRDVEVQRGHPLSDVLTALRRERVYERILLRGLAENDVRQLLALRAPARRDLERLPDCRLDHDLCGRQQSVSDPDVTARVRRPERAAA